MNFASDTTAPAHPLVIEAMNRVNKGIEPAGDYALSHEDENLITCILILLKINLTRRG